GRVRLSSWLSSTPFRWILPPAKGTSRSPSRATAAPDRAVPPEVANPRLPSTREEDAAYVYTCVGQLLGRKRPSLQFLAVDGFDGPVRVRQRDSLPSPSHRARRCSGLR